MNRKGFTLVELLGTIVIIGLVIAGSAFGIIKLIDESKSEGKNISIASIEKDAGVYAEEKNDDENYWQTMTRDDIKGEYFCVTIGELQNKGFIKNDLDFDSISSDNKKINKSTYVGIKKDAVLFTKSNPTLLDNTTPCVLSEGNTCTEKDVLYGVCTGNILNEELNAFGDVKAKGTYTDEIYEIEFNDVEAKNDVEIKINKRWCEYDQSSGFSNKNQIVEATRSGNVNTCNISGLDDKTTYYVRACETTEGGSQSCSKVIEPKTQKVQEPTFTLSDKVNIIYNDEGIKPGNASYYFKSNIDATSSVPSYKCDLTTDNTTDKEKKIFSCEENHTNSIAKNIWYKSSEKNISLSYSTNGTGRVDTITTDKSGNFAENYKEFVIYKTLFKKGEATTIGGGTADISKFCLAPLNGSCKITSPSIAKEGYTAVGWNTNSSATTASWKAETEQAVSSDGTYYPILSIKVYNINYNANGGSGAPSGQTKKHGDSITLSTTKPTRSNYDFIGWNTASNGTGTSYASGATYSANADATLYAQWKANTCTITYDANGGRNAPSAQTVNCGSKATISRSTPSRSGYDFTGWNTNRYGSGTNYYSRSSYTINSDLYLYAQWEEEEEEPYFLLDYVSPPSTVLHGSYGSRPFDVGFSVSSNIGITTSDCHLEVYSSDCALKSYFGVGPNCLNNSWMALSNAVINAYYYTKNDNRNSANASTNNAEHCITYRAYAPGYNRISDNTKTECYTIQR